MHIVLITRNRLKLLDQTLTTLQMNAVGRHCLSVVVDQPADQDVIDWVSGGIWQLKLPISHWTYKLKINDQPMGVGGSKNLGASLQGFDENFLMFSDDDCCYLAGWDLKVEHVLANHGIAVLGGCQHPFHSASVSMTWGGIQLRYVDATAGYCMAMRSISGHE